MRRINGSAFKMSSNMAVRESNLKWISFTLQLDHHRCIHTAQKEGDTLWNPPNLISVKFRQSGQKKKERKPDLQSTGTQYSSTLIFCHIFRGLTRTFNWFRLFFILTFNEVSRNIFIGIIL